MSNVGKSVITAGLCRIFHQDGYQVTPFKSQNMALNSYVTEDGLEMGRAQVMQAEAAGIKPRIEMNPILLKPTSHVGSQVIVNGVPLNNMPAKGYYQYKQSLMPEVLKAYATLDQEFDIIVIEGAGSAAELNLKDNDLVNMGLAKEVDAPVLLVGDIDRGGIFAQLIGTIMLLEEEERDKVKGLIVNKFRGDKSIFDSGVTILEERTQIPVVGVTPYVEVQLEDEDSLSYRFNRGQEREAIDLVVIQLPHISNFTDFNPLENFPGVSLRYVKNPSDLKEPDMIFLPGTKNTIEDLLWLRQSGLEGAILRLVSQGVPLLGICGGYQMLGEEIHDPDHVEGGGTVRGMGLLPMKTVFQSTKTRTQVRGRINEITGLFKNLTGMEYEGYEIHMGASYWEGELPSNDQVIFNGCNHGGQHLENVYGTYVHGILDKEGISNELIRILAHHKGITMEELEDFDFQRFKEEQYDKLADALRKHLDMNKIYEIMGLQPSRS